MRGSGRRWMTVAVVLAGMISGGRMYLSEMREAQIRQEVSAGAVSEDMVIPGGMPVGIYLEAEGVLVLGTDKVECMDGSAVSPAENIVRAGDYIVGINEREIHDKKELVRTVKNLTGEEVVLKLKRDKRPVEVRVKPVRLSPKECKLGIWVRDSTQGLGTVTFLTGDGRFGALGHGIHDSDTNTLFEISDGALYETSIRNIQKGKNGTPGGMEGVIIYNGYNRLGRIEKNTDEGIYGTAEKIDGFFQNLTPIPAAPKDEIREGNASIRCMVDGSVRDYDIRITEINTRAREVNKGIVLEVTDPGLLSVTGGIVQGMSGSPIIQDGKLVGAVTHVFVKNSAKGYGIFVENMLKNI